MFLFYFYPFCLFDEKMISFFAFFFQQQLGKLMVDINNTEPHYIRCIKPNSVKKPKVFKNKSVVEQLRSGVTFLQVLCKICPISPFCILFLHFLKILRVF